MRRILRVQVGSGVHGTSVSGQDDREEMGICLEPAAFVTGLTRVPSGIRAEGSPVEFEQYERHTVWDKPGGLANRSGAGHLDVCVYVNDRPYAAPPPLPISRAEPESAPSSLRRSRGSGLVGGDSGHVQRQVGDLVFGQRRTEA
jgi:hypothetical protein